MTAYELVYENIPATLICDDMVAALMKSRNISAVVVGADRVAANGDTANKIGTYQVIYAIIVLIEIFLKYLMHTWLILFRFFRLP